MRFFKGPQCIHDVRILTRSHNKPMAEPVWGEFWREPPDHRENHMRVKYLPEYPPQLNFRLKDGMKLF